MAKKHFSRPNALPTLQSNFNRYLWDLPLPGKIKIHFWRMYNNFVPSFSNLNKWHLNATDLCPLCGAREELVDFMCCGSTL